MPSSKQKDESILDVLHRQLTETHFRNFSHLSINTHGKRQKTHYPYEFEPIKNPVFEETEALLSANLTQWVIQRLRALHKIL